MGVRDQVADFLGSLILVYTLLLIAYVVSQLIFSLGARVPYSRWSDAVLGFLRDVALPYLALFRWVPRIGPLDLSPMVAIFALQIVGGLIVTLIRGPA